MTMLASAPMAKRKTQTGTARFSEDLIFKAGVVAASRDISVPDYLNSLLEGPIEADYREEIQRQARGLDVSPKSMPSKRKKGDN